MAKTIIFSLKALGAMLIIGSGLVSCKTEPCLDTVLIQQLEQEMFSWYVNDTTHQVFLLTDRHGIGQSLIVDKPTKNKTEIQVEDDCGQTSAGYHYSLQYITSVSPYHLMVDINGAAPGYGGYTIEISWMHTLKEVSRKAVFDLQTGKSANAEALCQVLGTFTTGETTYHKVLEIVFDGNLFPNAIKKIWFAQKMGIIAFEDELGNRFQRTTA